MISFAGSKGSLKLFVDNDSAVVVDTSVNMIVGSGDADVVFSAYEWDEPTGAVSTNVLELAASALTTLDINVITASGRMYTIPDGVKAEAKKSLEWRKEHKRGGTPVGLNTARTLAKGGQIGIEKIRHIAKYFPRHEVDKKGKGWKPGEDNFPSNGRIAWALWGGDAAQRWASAIVERENKKALRAGGYAMPGYDRSADIYSTPNTYNSEVDSFKAAYELDPTSGPEFMARVRLDGSGFDRLYKIETDGSVCIWDDGRWDDLGHVDGDVWSYDQALDDEYDDCEKDHVLLDPQTAMLMSAMWQNDPYQFISIDDIDPEEASLVREAYPQEDWKVVDYVITAAGEGGGAVSGTKPSGSINPNDSVDTPAEKAQRASSQQRDATGKFAQAGGRVVVGGDAVNGRGTLLSIGNNGMGTVQLDNGRNVDVPVKMTKPESEVEAAPVAPNPAVGKPLDVEGILGEPRTPKSMPAAQLPGTYPPMGASDLKAVVNDWGNWVNEQRAAFKPLTNADVRAYAKATNQRPGRGDIRPETAQKVATVKDGKIVVQKAAAPSAKQAITTADKTPTNANRAIKMQDQKQAATAKSAQQNATGNQAAQKAIRNSDVNPAAPAQAIKRDDAKAVATKANVTKNAQDKQRAQEAIRKSEAPKTSPDAVERRAAQGGNPAPKPVALDENGRYTVQKGDSLWSIADKNKPAGKSTAEYWAEVMKANPKSNFKSGNPSLIYSGEKVSLPGQKPKPVGAGDAQKRANDAIRADDKKAQNKATDKNIQATKTARDAIRKDDKAAADTKANVQKNAQDKQRAQEAIRKDDKNPATAQRAIKADDRKAADTKANVTKNAQSKQGAQSAIRKDDAKGSAKQVQNSKQKAQAALRKDDRAAAKAKPTTTADKVEKAADKAVPKKYNPWTDSAEAKEWKKSSQWVNKTVGDAVDGVGKAVAEGAKNLFQPAKKSGKAGANKKK